MDIEHLRNLRDVTYKRLCALELNEAAHGSDTQAHIVVDIALARKKLSELDSEIERYFGGVQPVLG